MRGGSRGSRREGGELREDRGARRDPESEGGEGIQRDRVYYNNFTNLLWLASSRMQNYCYGQYKCDAFEVQYSIFHEFG